MAHPGRAKPRSGHVGDGEARHRADRGRVDPGRPGLRLVQPSQQVDGLLSRTVVAGVGHGQEGVDDEVDVGRRQVGLVGQRDEDALVAIRQRRQAGGLGLAESIYRSLVRAAEESK